MLLDVLPQQESQAKDISLWHSAIVLPQILATPVAGWIRDEFQFLGKGKVECLGYKVIFFISIIYFFLGAEMTRRINGMT